MTAAGAIGGSPAAGTGAAGLSARHREWLAGYLFVAPDALGLLVFVAGPMLLSLTLGFFSVSGFGTYQFVGLANYRRMLADPLFLDSFRVTVTYVVALVPGLYVTGLGLALLVQRKMALVGLFRTLFFLPHMVSLVVVGLVWQVVLPYTKTGVIGGIMLGLGRALGETMAVTFVIGNFNQLESLSLFEAANSITSALANEFAEAGEGLHQAALMYLGLVLFFITFVVLSLSKLLLSQLRKNEGART